MRSTAEPAFVHLLLAHEAGEAQDAQALIEAVEGVCEKLRLHLSKRIGREGFRSLLARALTLAAAQHPSLHGVRAGENGILEGMPSVSSGDQQETGGAASRIIPYAPEEILQGAVALVTHLLGLLITFIGEDLTRRILSTLWPMLPSADAASDESSTPDRKEESA